jgi:hypothetical protein
MNASRDAEFSILRFASARTNSPTNFVVSSEIGCVSTRGSIDAVQQSTFSDSIRCIETRWNDFLWHHLQKQSALATL